MSGATDQLQLDPVNTALLVMDYQVAIVERLAERQALLERAKQAIAAVREHGGHIGWVRVGFDDSEFDAIPATSAMARMITPDRRTQFHADAPSTQIQRDLDPRPQDITVRKTRVGAFTTTDLGPQLRARTVSTLLLAGISTSGVVLSTVREAMDRDFQIVVVKDACADPDPDTHAFLMDTIFPRHTTVLHTADLSTIWRTGTSS